MSPAIPTISHSTPGLPRRRFQTRSPPPAYLLANDSFTIATFLVLSVSWSVNALPRTRGVFKTRKYSGVIVADSADLFVPAESPESGNETVMLFRWWPRNGR